ncbi:MAG: TonB-dependent receptor [Opitutae bacterium]|nr:TonB-dependent receptor [Opitutae bacterium]
MQKSKTPLILLLPALLAAGSLFAQTPPAAPATPQTNDDDVVKLEKFEVNGVPIDQSVLPTTRPFNSVYGFDRSILETPRNVTIFSREQLTAISVQDVRDFTKLTASSYTRSNFGAPSNPDIRGQTADIFLNGMRVGLGSNGNGLPINFNSVESINIVKGPATAVYGASQYVGGYADLITKRPTFDSAKGSVAVTVGSYNTLRWTADYNVPVSKKTAYRLSYSGEDSEGYYYDGKKKTEALYFALTHRANDHYEAFFNTEVFYADYTENFGINRPTQALIDSGLYQTGVNNNPAPNFALFPFGYADANGAPITFGNINVVAGTPATPSDAQNSRFVVSGFPAVNRIALGPVVQIDRRSRLLRPGDDSEGYSINSQLIQTFQPRAGLAIGNNTFFRYVNRNTLSSYSYSEIIDPSWSLENRTEFRFDKDNHQINTGVALRYQYVEAYNDFFNEPAAVWDLTRDHNFINYANSVNFPNPFTQIPVPGHPGRVYTPDNGDSGISKVSTFSPFYQHNWKINDALSLDFGARVDIMRADFHIDWVNSIIGPQRIADKITVSLPGYNASLNYALSSTRSLYATYNYSKNPVGATGNGGGITTGGLPKFDPGSLKNEAKLTEAGYKQTFNNKRGFLGLAVFQQDRTALQQDRTTRLFRTRGIELEANYQPNKSFFFTVGYSYLESTVNQAEFDVGNTSLTSPLDRFFILGPGEHRRQGVPRNTFNGLATYKWENGFGVTAGLVWNSDINNNVVGTLVIPPQYTLDLTAFYSTKRYEVRLAVLNATDQKNWGAPNAVYGNESITAELPIHAELTVKYKF